MVTATTKDPEVLVDLHLDDDDEPEEHPRRLLHIDNGDVIVAYGGNFGKIVNLSTRKVVRTTEDAIRAIAINKSGTRVVVGSDSGESVIYVYPSRQEQQDGTGGTVHPFVALPKTSTGETQDDDDDDIDHFMSQTSETIVRKGEVMWDASRDDDAMRDYVWLKDDMTLLCASEKHWFWLDCSTETSCLTKHFASELDEAHSGSGIRSLTLNDEQTTLITLDMEGRACWWQPDSSTTTSAKNLQWKLLHREATKCVSRKDVGEVFGSSSWCRSSRPHFVTSTVAVLPGEPFLQLRRVSSINRSVESFDQIVEDRDDGSVKGHVQAIVTMCSRDGYVITSGRDGRVIVWDIQETKDAVSCKFVRLLGEYESASTDMLWHVDPSGKDERLLILTAKGQLVTIQGRDNIAPVRGKTNKGSSSAVASTTSSKTYSSNAVATQDTASSDKDSPVEKENAPRSTKPSVETIRVDEDSDDDNLFGTSDSPPPSSSKAKEKPAAAAAAAVAANENDEDEDDDPFGATGNDESPPMSSAPQKNRFVDDEAAEDDDGDDSVMGRSEGNTGAPGASTAAPSSPMGANHDDFDDDEEEDDDLDDMPPPYHGNAPPSYANLKLPEPQAPFAPSSTPLDLTRRFMCWNHIGSVTRLFSDDGRTRVDIDFTDAAFRRPISITDNLGFLLGSLGEDGGIFCTDLSIGDDDNAADDAFLQGLSEATKAAVKKSQQSRMRDGNKSKPTGSSIYFHRFESNVGHMRDKDWHLTLPNDERALGCACGEGWAAVMTSRRFLRLFSSGGNQGQVLWLPGEPVTMAGRSRFLVVVYHDGTPLPDGTQKLGYMFMDAASNGRVLYKGSLACVSKASSLTWIGLSNDHSVMAMDTDGMLSMLVSSGSAVAEWDAKTSHWEWMPMLDTVGLRKSADDNFWPITVYDGKLVCVPLKGGTRHPDATRRPVTTSLSFRLPLARGPLIQTNALEELSVRADIALNQKKVFHDVVYGTGDEEFENEYLSLSAQVDKVTLKMFAGVVEAGKLDRALDLVERLHLEKSYDLAMTIADHHRKLVDRIEEAKDRRFGSDYVYDQTAGQDDYEDEEEAYESSRITPDATMGRKRTMNDEPTSAIARMIRRKQGFA